MTAGTVSVEQTSSAPANIPGHERVTEPEEAIGDQEISPRKRPTTAQPRNPFTAATTRARRTVRVVPAPPSASDAPGSVDGAGSGTLPSPTNTMPSSTRSTAANGATPGPGPNRVKRAPEDGSQARAEDEHRRRHQARAHLVGAAGRDRDTGAGQDGERDAVGDPTESQPAGARREGEPDRPGGGDASPVRRIAARPAPVPPAARVVHALTSITRAADSVLE